MSGLGRGVSMKNEDADVLVFDSCRAVSHGEQCSWIHGVGGGQGLEGSVMIIVGVGLEGGGLEVVVGILVRDV